jgi:hypothetical protein
MRSLDDIIIGFLIFFAIDRTINLFSKNVVQPWASATTKDPTAIDNCKTLTELVCLIGAATIVFKCRGFLQKLDNK